MYAVVQVSGRQEKVIPGETISVEKIIGEVGDVISLGSPLAVVDGIKLDLTSKVEVKAKIVSHGKGDKVRVFRKLRRKRFIRNKGHRQPYTELEILSW
ncbi:50S ribosomal protein L21 [Candidatus Gracilibacteria bacterium]|nr:50S ribosomal protein L21 [Candidatus Gracilibacteria bacterium]